MSIASQLTVLESNISDAYGAIESKGGTIPEHKNMENLTPAIQSIDNGFFTLATRRSGDSVVIYKKPTSKNMNIVLPEATSGRDYLLAHLFEQSYGLESLEITGGGRYFIAPTHAFERICYGNSALKSVSISGFSQINGYSFREAFKFCANLETARFEELNNLRIQSFEEAFSSCNNLDIYFVAFNPAPGTSNASDCFKNMLNGAKNCRVHFSAQYQTNIENFLNTADSWGGTNCVAVYDL